MKLLLFAPFCLLLACSSPRYLYRFPEAPGVVVTPKPPVSRVVEPAPPIPLDAPEDQAVYSADAASPVAATPKRIREVMAIPVAKSVIEPLKTTPPAEKHMDGDLKRSIIFAAAGVVALIIGGQVFYVAGSLSLLIGLIFGIKWFIRQ